MSDFPVFVYLQSQHFSLYLLCHQSLSSFHHIMLSSCVGLVLLPKDMSVLPHLGLESQRKNPGLLLGQAERRTIDYKIVSPSRHIKCLSELTKAIVWQSSQQKTKCLDTDFFLLQIQRFFFLFYRYSSLVISMHWTQLHQNQLGNVEHTHILTYTFLGFWFSKYQVELSNLFPRSFLVEAVQYNGKMLGL